MLREGLILAGNVGVLSIALAILKYHWNRRRLQRFRGILHIIGRDLFVPEDLSEDEWKALAATYMHDSGFAVEEIEKWLMIGVLIAKAEIAQALRKVQEQYHGRNLETGKGIA